MFSNRIFENQNNQNIQSCIIFIIECFKYDNQKRISFALPFMTEPKYSGSKLKIKMSVTKNSNISKSKYMSQACLHTNLLNI